MENKIDTVSGRAKLSVRREPYWHRISKGLYLGYRKMSTTSAGSWLVRHRKEDGCEVQLPLGKLEQYRASDRFDKALEEARLWLTNTSDLDPAVDTGSYTVADACDDYVAYTKDMRGEKAAHDQAARYIRWVEPDPIETIKLINLTREHMVEFRRRLVAAPLMRKQAGETRTRSKDTVNRDMAAVRAALNLAFASGKVRSDFAWREPLKSFKNVSKRRGLYLDRDQRLSLIEHSPDDLALFLRSLSVLPLRPGALAALRVSDYDARLQVLRIGTDKVGQDRRIKLPPSIAELMAKASENRPGTSPLLVRSHGEGWTKDAWTNPVKVAVISADLPVQATAYTIRHSVITDLVHGGLDLLTVAQLSGTSVAMIEKHYGHLRSEVAAEALSKLIL